MRYAKFDEVIDSIHAVLFERKALRQNQIFHLMNSLAQVRCSQGIPQRAEIYRNVQHRLDEIWQYREWESMSVEQAFLYGQLYGCVKLCEYEEMTARDQQWMEIFVSKYGSDRWELFHAIAESPGIRHKDLAKRIDQQISRLSQIMNEEDMQELIDHTFTGREKHYFLRPKGKEVLRKMEEERKQQDRENILQQILTICSEQNDKTTYIPRNINVVGSGSALSVMAYNILEKKIPWEMSGNLIPEYKVSSNQYYNQIESKSILGGRSKCRAVENNYQEIAANHLAIGSGMS